MVGLTDKQLNVLNYFIRNPQATYRDTMSVLKINSFKALENHLYALEAKGFVVKGLDVRSRRCCIVLKDEDGNCLEFIPGHYERPAETQQADDA